jgi:asparagine synthase (glutamine-hydrolysing)
MCGIGGIFGDHLIEASMDAIIRIQNHRGPDANGIYIDSDGVAILGHNRLSIIDLSSAGAQPMSSFDRRYWIVFNGEIYNYLELREQLSDYPYQSQTDTEVILAAYMRWGESCPEHFLGMFAFMIWDQVEKKLFVVRDRFGVKPLYYGWINSKTLAIASEIKALRAVGVQSEPNPTIWATYLSKGLHDHSSQTFWKDIYALPAGHIMKFRNGNMHQYCWYDLAKQGQADFDNRPIGIVEEEYQSLMEDCVRLRFRADVPVGINLSGGLDSSALLSAVQHVQDDQGDVKAFTFATGDPNYDETPYAQSMLSQTHHPSVLVFLSPDDVPELSLSVQQAEDEPFGGIPTLAYARLFEIARSQGVIVLLDGQGMDEQWAGYDYYSSELSNSQVPIVQGTRELPVRPNSLLSEFAAQASSLTFDEPFPDRLRNLQYRDIRYTKIPRALRFNDRVSMRASVELREPFLDHRLVEFAFRQPETSKINKGINKFLLRQILHTKAPNLVVNTPKRPLQTPQREWLRGPLRDWTIDTIELALKKYGGIWFDSSIVRSELKQFFSGVGDNSFFVWQWISIGLMAQINDVVISNGDKAIHFEN